MPNVSSFGAQTDNATVQGTITDRAMAIPDVPPSGLMSVGPRVTPHFVKPSLWSALTTYHFFDAVHDAAGASYVAIKPEVPAGTELTNEGYWFLWADPNSQFADLSELVKTFNGRISQNTEAIVTNKNATDKALKTKAPNNHASEETTYGVGNEVNYGHVRLATEDTPLTSDANNGIAVTPAFVADVKSNPKAIIIGDSYSTEYTSTNWWKLMCKALGVEPHCYAVGGAGFAITDNLFSSQATKAINDALKNVKYVFVYGGINDMANSKSASGILSGCNTVLKTLKTAYPNAIYYVMGVNTWKNMYTRDTNTTFDVCNALRSSAEANGAFYINTTFACFARDAWFINPGEPGQNHPTADGQTVIYEVMANAMTGNAISNGNKLIANFTLNDHINAYIYRYRYDELEISITNTNIQKETIELEICAHCPDQFILSKSNANALFSTVVSGGNKCTINIFPASASGEANNVLAKLYL